LQGYRIKTSGVKQGFSGGRAAAQQSHGALRAGIGNPVGTGKTILGEALCRCLANRFRQGGADHRSEVDLVDHQKIGAGDAGASLAVMERDAGRMRGDRPFVFANMKSGEGLEAIIAFLLREGLLV